MERKKKRGFVLFAIILIVALAVRLLIPLLYGLLDSWLDDYESSGYIAPKPTQTINAREAVESLAEKDERYQAWLESLPTSAPCRTCNGTGKCLSCRGEGKTLRNIRTGEMWECFVCDGSGKCHMCGGE